MIKKTDTYSSELKPSIIEYEDGDCFDFIDFNDIPYNEIIAKGLNFNFWHITTEEYKEYDNEINNYEWQYIEYANVVEQTKDYTILYTRLLTNDTDNGEFQLECEYSYKIIHKHSIKEIKEKYEKDNNLFNTIKTILINQYGFSESNHCTNYDCIEEEYVKKVKLTKEFTNAQTIGEVKEIINNAYKYAKKSTKLLTNGQAYKELCFTPKGAIGNIKLKYEIL